jgi:putative hydrolase of the HAD superfamily
MNDIDWKVKRALVFDLDGTLYRQSPVRKQMLVRLLKAHALRPGEGMRVFRLISAYRHAQEALRLEPSGGGSASRQLTIACERAGLSVEVASPIIRKWMDQEPLNILRPHRREGVSELLDAARNRQMKLGLLSDYPAHDKLTALEIAHYFDVVVSAQDPEVESFKPSPRGLQETLRKLEVTPAEAVYVGDRPEVDHAAAHAADVDCFIISSKPAETNTYRYVSSFTELLKLLP